MITNYYTAWPNRKIIDMHSHLEMICHNPIYVKIWSLNSTSIQYIYTTGSHVYLMNYRCMCVGGGYLKTPGPFSLYTNPRKSLRKPGISSEFCVFSHFFAISYCVPCGFLEIVYCLGLGQGWVNSYRCRENTSTAWESRQISSMSAGLGYTDSE